ncbi:MAG: TIM barrel protein [Candidatus Colwellbacteria bacterium]|nr:TIM barrel protein [Candidatus Colwellbacteria bacterium]
MSIRVREILDSLNRQNRERFKKLLPKEARNAPKDLANMKTVFPAALKKILPKENSASILGLLTEEMLKLSEPTTESICKLMKSEIPKKVKESKTTTDYVQKIEETRRCLENVWIKKEISQFVPIIFEDSDDEEIVPTFEESEMPLYDVEFIGEGVQGHPDIVTESGIFEIKTSTQLKKSWLYFILQLFCYGCLSDTHTRLHLVLPLHKCVHSFDISGWDTRKQFRELLLEMRDVKLIQDMNMKLMWNVKRQYNIGSHVALVDGVKGTSSILYPGVPAQIFLGSNQSYSISLDDGDLASMLESVLEKEIPLFIHSPYLINLCTDEEDNDKGLQCLQKYLTYSKSIGARGTVVHVGKYTGNTEKKALEIMKLNILKCLEYATEECPLLLETPAGQGTETLTTLDEFSSFIREIDDKRFGVCVDTCHVWSTGILPSKYLSGLEEKGVVPRLIHYNDSAREFDCHVDRHECLGKGVIGVEELKKCAEFGGRLSIPMVQE